VCSLGVEAMGVLGDLWDSVLFFIAYGAAALLRRMSVGGGEILSALLCVWCVHPKSLWRALQLSDT
jgi:hypothetical protein